VVACNTATAAAIKLLRQDFADLPIVGIEPALKPAAAQSRTGHIAVMATRGTLNSEKFRALLASLNGRATFILQPCDGLADAIERNDAIKIGAAISDFTGAIGTFGVESGEVDTLVLGCTHYPFAGDTLRSLVGEKVVFLEGGMPVARQTRKLLTERGWLAETQPLPVRGAPLPLFICTGAPETLRCAVERWLQLAVSVQAINID
jgi:glutamate racemase